MEKISRRSFFKLAGAAAATAATDAHALTGDKTGAARAAAPSPQAAYTFFNPVEASFIEAAVDRLIPPDELGPGAVQAGVPFFIDRQLGAAWGAGERLYRSGPFAQGTASQGYQLPFTPAELFRNALRGIGSNLS